MQGYIDESQPNGTKPTNPTSPVRFATSTNAFGLSASPASSSSSHKDGQGNLLSVETSPVSGVKPRLRRPSMLSLAQTASFHADPSGEDEDAEPTAGPSRPQTSGNPFDISQPKPRWSSGPGFLGMQRRNDSGSNIGMEGLTTSTPPMKANDRVAEDLPMPDRSPPKWLPGHLGRRKGKMRADDVESAIQPGIHRPPFTGKPLPASLVATLDMETDPLSQEIQSEARYQRLISSHPRAVPFTPRTSRSSRGRFPETAGDDDDDDDFPSRRAIWASRAWTRRSSSDSDSDDMPMDDPPESVNAAFAAGMDMDRAAGSSETGWLNDGSGKSTPATSGAQAQGSSTPQNIGGWDKSRPPRMSFSNGLVSSPGTGFALPSAFGGLGMGPGTPIGSPTVERLDLATSPNAIIASPSLMQYRESSGGSASVRPGKRKAQTEDRFDPYKRPRGSSPSFPIGGFQSSPSRSNAFPIPPPSSGGMVPPSPLPLYSSLLGTAANTANLRQGPGRNGHPYTRPMSSRSRAGSPALSIGSASGALSSSLGNSNRGTFSLAQAFVPTGQAAQAQGTPQGQMQGQGQAQQGGLGGLGLLSLANHMEEEENIRSRSGSGNGGMEED